MAEVTVVEAVFRHDGAGMDKMRHEDAAEIQALIEALDGSINTFNLYDPRKKYPRAETGAIVTDLHVSEVKIHERYWQQRFGLEPALYTLRKAEREWKQSAAKGKSPLYPEQVIALYSDAAD